MTEQPNPVKTPPYIGTSAFDRFLELARQKSWPSVDSNTLQANGLSQSVSFALISALKFLGLITDEGKRTTLLEEITASTSEDRLQAVLKKIVEQSYAELLEAIVLPQATSGQVDAYFRRKGIAPTVATRSARFFIYLANRAGLEVGDTVEVYKRASAVHPRVKSSTEQKGRPNRVPNQFNKASSAEDYETYLLKILMEKINSSNAIPDFETVKQIRELIESIEKKEKRRSADSQPLSPDKQEGESKT